MMQVDFLCTFKIKKKSQTKNHKIQTLYWVLRTTNANARMAGQETDVEASGLVYSVCACVCVCLTSQNKVYPPMGVGGGGRNQEKENQEKIC